MSQASDNQTPRTIFETSIRLELGIERLTVQSGGMLNGTLLRADLIDHVSIAITPLLVGGATAPTIIDSEAFHSLDGLKGLRPLTLAPCETPAHSFPHVRYDATHRPTEE